MDGPDVSETVLIPKVDRCRQKFCERGEQRSFEELYDQIIMVIVTLWTFDCISIALFSQRTVPFVLLVLLWLITVSWCIIIHKPEYYARLSPFRLTTCSCIMVLVSNLLCWWFAEEVMIGIMGMMDGDEPCRGVWYNPDDTNRCHRTISAWKQGNAFVIYSYIMSCLAFMIISDTMQLVANLFFIVLFSVVILRHTDQFAVDVGTKINSVIYCSIVPICLIGVHLSIKTLLRNNYAQRKMLDARNFKMRAMATELRSIIDEANAPIFGVNASGEVNVWNNKMAHVTGFTREEAIGASLVDTFISPQSRSVVESVMQNAVRGDGVDQYEVTFLTKGNVGTRSILVNATARRNERGESIGVVGVGQDVTELLKTKLEAMTEKQRADAEGWMNEFLAHEVRNPLTVALMSAEEMLKRNGNGEPGTIKSKEKEENSQDIINVMQNLEYILELLTNMLDMNKLEAGAISIKADDFSLSEDVLLPVQRMLTARSGSQTDGIEVRLHCDPDLPTHLTGDSLRLKQVLMNLGSNSLKFVSSGYVEVCAQAGFASPAASEDGDTKVLGERIVRLSVNDSGPGIPLKEQARMFTRYVQLNSHKQGTGIGLHLCHKLVEAMGGTIRIDSEYECGIADRNGCSFVVELPIRTGEASGWQGKDTAVPDALQLAQVLHPNLGLLIVDDNGLIRKTFKRQFQAITDGWQIHTAENGEAALQMIQEDATRFDVVTVDMYMNESGGVLTGVETTRQMRGKLAGQDPQPVIIGLSGNDMAEAFEGAGADFSWRKPVSFKSMSPQVQLHQILCARQGLPRGWRVLVADDQRMMRSLVIKKLQGMGAWASTWTFVEVETGAGALEAVPRMEAAASLDRNDGRVQQDAWITGGDESVQPVGEAPAAESSSDSESEFGGNYFDVVLLDEHMKGEMLGSDVARVLRRRFKGSQTLLVSISGNSLTKHDGEASEAGNMEAVRAGQPLFDVVWGKPLPATKTMMQDLANAWARRASLRFTSPELWSQAYSN